MTTLVSSSAELRAAEAQILARREQYLRAWEGYLAEQRAELRARQEPQRADADDLIVPLGAEQTRAALPQALRQELGNMLNGLREDALLRQPGADADVVLAEVLDQLEAELSGRRHPQGLALVRLPDQEQPVTFDRSAMTNQVAVDDLAALIGRRPRRRRRRWPWVIGALAVLAVVVFVVRPFAPAKPRTVAPPPTVRIGSQDVTAWDVQALMVAGLTTSQPITALDGAGMAVCVTTAQARALQPGVTVALSGTTSLRTYQIVSLQPDPVSAELVLADCTATPARRLAGAVLQTATTAQPLDPVLVTAVQVWARDTRADIPEGQMEVVLTLAPGAPTNGVLRLPDGGTRTAGPPETTDQGVRLRYLVPAATAPQRMGWEVARGAELPRRLALDVPAPTDRAAQLGRLLRVADPQATHLGATLTLTVTLQRVSSAPLALAPEDLTVVDSQHRGIAARWQAPTLASDAPTTVVLSIPLDQASGPLDVALGAWRARLSVGGSDDANP